MNRAAHILAAAAAATLTLLATPASAAKPSKPKPAAALTQPAPATSTTLGPDTPIDGSIPKPWLTLIMAMRAHECIYLTRPDPVQFTGRIVPGAQKRPF